MKRLGIDIGSLFLSSVLLEGDRVLRSDYRELKGDVPGTLAEVLGLYRDPGFDRLGVSGHLQRGQGWIDSTLALIRGASFLLPGCRNVFSIGGQSYLLIFFDEHGRYREHTPNPPCAAGTGSFLEQQAERLALSTQELSERAMGFGGKAPTIATRCSVFAKSDIIHCMQEGHSAEAICAGLCEGIARGVVDALVKGRTLQPPVGVISGVAVNQKIVRSLESILGLEVTVPARPWAAGAIGAALLGQQTRLDPALGHPADRLARQKRAPLTLQLSPYPDFADKRLDGDIEVLCPEPRAGGTSEAYHLGIDIGSTSTKAALLDERGGVVCGLYRATRGEPIQAVQRILVALGRTVPDVAARLARVGTTGSGRSMIRELFGADLEENEISAHARAAHFLHPQVDTVIEIGGQDSKFTQMKNGAVVFSTMNYVCAAGTGSFIEEQAKRLGVTLEEVSALALGQSAPYTSDRCTVYMERDLNLLLQEGWSREAVLAAVLFSVRDNYLSKVVNRQRIGSHVVFQGATARNKALVAAFEQYLGQPVHVSPFCHLTGAIGVALLARDSGPAPSAFRLDGMAFAVEREVCKLCANHCDLTVVQARGRRAAWGMKCGRDYADQRRKNEKQLSRVELRMSDGPPEPPVARPSRGAIGLVDALYHREYNPLWRDFLTRLGFSPIVTGRGKRRLAAGKSLVNSDFCAPMILAHGAVSELSEQQVELIFCPALVNDRVQGACAEVPFKQKTTDSYFCYYSQYAPTILGNLTALPLQDRLISPLLSLRCDPPEKLARRVHEALAQKIPDLDPAETSEHFLAAFSRFAGRRMALRTNRPALSPAGLNVVLAGRPYIALDPALHLGIPRLLEDKGVTLFWQDEFDTESVELLAARPFAERMHWSYGHKLLAVAELTAREPNLFMVYLSCFRCSPDSFLIGYLKEIMAAYGKPFLVLQLDEHASDVGYTTRIEAALRTFEDHRQRRPRVFAPGALREPAPRAGIAPGDTILIPYINRLISGFWAACFAQEGHDARVLENSEKVLNAGYRFANGGECMPAVAIAGGTIQAITEGRLDPASTVLYLPTLCMACNFPQFPIMAGAAVRAAGIRGLKIAPINAMNPSESLSDSLSMKLFESSIAASLLTKIYHRLKPYQKQPGAAEAALDGAEAILLGANARREALRRAFGRALELFRAVERDRSIAPKPRIGILGDLYLKYNEVVNQNLNALIEELGGELLIPSFSEMTFHFWDVDARAGLERPHVVQTLQAFEQRYERLAADLLGDQGEPPWDECVLLLEKHGFAHYLAGETSINVGKALHLLTQKKVDALVHVNPMFCCPGVVTASLMRKIQADFAVPIIDLFYDGTGDPNQVLIPHLTTLTGPR